MQLFDAVLDFAARAVGFLIDRFRGLAFVGDHKAGIVFRLAPDVVDDLGFDDDAARALPTPGLIMALAIDARPLSLFFPLACLGQQRLRLALQHRIFGDAADILEPRHAIEIVKHRGTGKAAIEPQIDGRLGKRSAHQRQQARQ